MPSLVILTLLLITTIVAPPLLSQQAAELNVLDAHAAPSAAHLLGTDRLGRDILLRILVSARLSLSVALTAAGFSAVLGISAGVAATILTPRLRTIALRAIEMMIAFPGILVAIFVIAITGPGVAGVTLGVGVELLFSFARVSSALSMSVVGRDYIAAARVLGIRGPRLVFRYILPNVADALAITSTVRISASVVAVSSLSFLGLGVQPPDYDWGQMLTQGVQSFYLTPTAALAPAAAIAITALAFGFAGEGLARAMNPALWASTDAQTNRHEHLPPSVDLATTRVRGSEGHPLAAHREIVLEIRDLSVSFPGAAGRVRLVDDISFIVRKGEFVGIVGESGSGKTMTAMAIAQLVPYPGRVQGVVTLQGNNLADILPEELNTLLGTKIGVVFQDPVASLNPALRIGIQMTESAELHRKLRRSQATPLAVRRLQEVNMPTPAYQLGRHPHELSGGMRQRVMIAMGLMNEPALIIADEPTTALDVTVQAQIMDLLWRVNAEHATAILLISHNLGLISQNCQRILVMYAGRIVEELSTQPAFGEPRHPYTRALLSAVPEMTSPRDRPLLSIPGETPNPTSLPPGCAYQPRCPLAIEKCRVERPPLLLHPDGSRVACWVANEPAQPLLEPNRTEPPERGRGPMADT